MDQSFIDLYDEYTHKPLQRRVFLRRLADLAGGSAAALALLPLLENNYARAAMVPENDPRLETRYVTYPGASGDIRAYLARPKQAGSLPGVIVIHENRGLNPHIEDVARRTAIEGFVALAPDFLSPSGGTPGDPDEARNLIRQLDRSTTIQNAVAAIPYLKARPDVTGRIGCMGFCWGGGMANQLAVNSADLGAAAVYYGRQPASQDVPKIKAKMLLHYAGLDKRINKGVAAYEKALKAAGLEYKLYMYEGANHAFNNDTNAARYNPEAAKLAWGRTIAFLKATLSS